MCETLPPELLLPVPLDLAHSVSDDVGGLFATRREDNAFRSSVVGVDLALEVAESFELAEEVVDRLLAHASAGGELRRPGTLRAGVQHEVQMRRVEVVESVLVEASEHPP